MRTEDCSTWSHPVIIRKTDELVSVSPGRLRWLENSWAVIDLSGLLIEINHQLAAALLYWAAISIYVGSGSVPDY